MEVHDAWLTKEKLVAGSVLSKRITVETGEAGGYINEVDEDFIPAYC